MKTKGNVNIPRHLIGKRKPIVMFLGVGTALTLSGCDTTDYPYYAFTSKESCNTVLPGQCEAAYRRAEQEARRTALKYMLESECRRDFGDNVCFHSTGAWQPHIAGFITNKSPTNDFTQPFFTSRNPDSPFFGKAFTADGLVFDDLKNVDGKNLYLEGALKQSLPNSHVDRSSSGGQAATALAAAAGGYMASQALSKNGNQANYRQCADSGRDDCYTTTSGTAYVGTTSGNKTYRAPSQLEKTSKNTTYKHMRTVRTRSSGGFGSSGRSFGGFGG